MEKKFFKLLEYETEMKEKGKFLAKEDEEKYKELIKYRVSIFDHLKYEKKNQYLFCLNNFANGKINVNQYIHELFELENGNQKIAENLENDVERLKKFEPNPASKGFSGLIEELRSDIRVFEPDSDLRDDCEISEEELKFGVRDILLQIEKYS